ncbi:MAG: GAF domain-containing protein [Anaerolineales bacterium]|nr:GAF domain-containing protein [Anaerolineales bacterium]
MTDKNLPDKINNIFNEAHVPAPASLKEMAAMQKRIQELEEALKLQEQRTATAEQEAKHKQASTLGTLSASKASAPATQFWLAKFWNRMIEAHPSIQDVQQRNSARLASSFLFVILLLELTGVIASAFNGGILAAINTFIMPITATLISYLISRTKRYQVAIFIFALFYSSLAYLTIAKDTVDANTGTLLFIYIPISLIVASAFLSSWAVFALVIFNIFAFVLTVKSYLPATPDGFGVQAGLINGIGLVLILLTNFRKRNERQSLQEVRDANAELQIANTELISSRDQLEQRVHERTRDLELASEVGRTVTAKVDNLHGLLSEAVEQIRSRFNLYYAQIYLADRANRAITLRAGTGEAGKQLLQRGHQLLINNDSLNGRAALYRNAVIVADTANSDSFLPNPLLPKTRSEMAVPMTISDQVIGVIDLQSDTANSLNESNLPAFEALAGQLAVAIQNAALFEQAQQARAEVMEQAKRVSLSSWQSFLNAIDRSESIGYIFNQEEILPLVETAQKQTHPHEALIVPIQVVGAHVGEIQLIDTRNRKWSTSDAEIIDAVALQVAQHIDSLRLLAQSEKYRSEAEQISKRLTREAWDDYINLKNNAATGFIYEQNKVELFDEQHNGTKSLFTTRPVYVRNEQIGELEVESHENAELISAVAEQLSAHIENLRLLEQAELSRVKAQKSQEQFELSVAGSNDGLWDWNLITNEVYFSPRWKAMVGCGEDELNGGFGDFEKLLHPDDQERVAKEINDYLAGKIEDYSIEFRARHKQGHYVWILARGKALRNAEGAPYRMAGSHTDITERKETEAQIQENERRLQSILAALPISIAISRLSDGVLMYNNLAFSTLFGLSEKDLVGKRTPDFYYDPNDRAELFKDLQEKGSLSEYELRTKGSDGHLIWALLNVFPIRYGQDDCLLIGAVNVTTLKSIEESLQRRASDLSTVATVSTASSTLLDPAELLQTVVDITKEQFNLYHAHIYLTDEAQSALALSTGAGEIGKEMVNAGHSISLDAEKSLVARAARERDAVIINNVRLEEGFLPNPKLPETHAEMAIPMIVAGQVIGVFDVQSETENRFTSEDANIFTTLASQVAIALQNARLYQEQAATVAQLRELDRLKSSFLANMSHELRTPLNSILGFTDVMLEELDGPLTPNMDNDLKLIQKNGKHLLHLINDVLDMAKIESGKMNLVIEKFNLNETVEDVLSLTSSLANEKELALFIEPESDENVFIRADHTRLRQVLINVINNGIKFTEKGSVSIRITHQVNDVLIAVKDSGLGIPVEHLESVFSEFTQVDTSTTRKAGGTGLGLPISRRLIEMHGGKLWAESAGAIGKGSTFNILLPIEAVVSEATASGPLEKTK